MTVRNGLRDKLLYALLITGLGFVLSSLILAEMLVGSPVKIVKDLGLSLILFFGFFQILFSRLLATDDKSLFLLLSRPLARWQWLVGTYLGHILLAWGSVLSFTFLMYGLFMLHGETWHTKLFLAILMIGFELAVLTAIALLFSVLMTSATLIRFCTMGVFLVGHWIKEVQQILQTDTNQAFQTLMDGVSLIVPHLHVFDWKTEAVYQLDIEPSQIVWAVVYGLGYIGLLLLISRWAFSKRDL